MQISIWGKAGERLENTILGVEQWEMKMVPNFYANSVMDTWQNISMCVE